MITHKQAKKVQYETAHTQACLSKYSNDVQLNLLQETWMVGSVVHFHQAQIMWGIQKLGQRLAQIHGAGQYQSIYGRQGSQIIEGNSFLWTLAFVKPI